ncbi:MAG: hypothetical protein R3C19_15340 [Planctomycetaceae bacterium]
MVDRHLIEVLDPDAVNGELQIVDEYGDEEQKDRFVLRDVYEQLRSAQLLSTRARRIVSSAIDRLSKAELSLTIPVLFLR